MALDLEKIGRYGAGVFDGSAAEVVAHDPLTQRLFVTNDNGAAIDVLDVSEPENLSLLFSIDVTPYGDAPTSCAVSGGVLAVAVKADPVQAPGQVVFFNADGEFLNAVTAGALPDNLVFTPDGSKVIIANEGEPDDDYVVDPEGSVSIIDISGGVGSLTDADVRTADFTRFNGTERRLRRRGVRIFGPGASVAQDLEPEFVAVSADGKEAYVTLQENNAIAVVDVEAAFVKSIFGLGVKLHVLRKNALDASDRDGATNIRPWPVCGMYQPDGIAAYTYRGRTFLLTANEGDARDYGGFSEERRLKDFNGEADGDDGVVRGLSHAFFFRNPDLLEDENLGRLRTTTAPPFGKFIRRNGNEVFWKLFSYGSRSFSVWLPEGLRVFDSSDDFEQITSQVTPEFFNSNNDETGADGRSDDKGPEPESIVIGEIDGRGYAFIGLERTGGILVYDITNPWRPNFVTYTNPRLQAEDPGEATVDDDLGPEGLAFISGENSPNGKPLLIVAHEVSGSTVVFQINP